VHQFCPGAPDSSAAKELLARTCDPMGYMAEAATWRNSYLTAAADANATPTLTKPIFIKMMAGTAGMKTR
jgi:alkyl sulfatase BDS1-like metallo-beta-lactamase superfamily hydrolase